MSGKRWKWFHFCMIFFFISLWIVAIPTGWINSVAFVSHMSMLALVYTAVSAWQGGRTEEKQEEKDKA